MGQLYSGDGEGPGGDRASGVDRASEFLHGAVHKWWMESSWRFSTGTGATMISVDKQRYATSDVVAGECVGPDVFLYSCSS